MDLRGSRNGRKSSRPTPLRINQESRPIRKAQMPLPVVQQRVPVIIHTYSPKVHKTDASDFMRLVQSLTGSSDTRMRCRKSKKQALSVSSSPMAGAQILKSSPEPPSLEPEYKPNPYFHDQKMSTFPSPSASCSSDSGAHTESKYLTCSSMKDGFAISPKSPLLFDSHSHIHSHSLVNESPPGLVSSDDHTCEGFLGSAYAGSFTSLITGSEYNNYNMNDLPQFSSFAEPFMPGYDSKLFVLQPPNCRDMGWSFFRTDSTYSEV